MRNLIKLIILLLVSVSSLEIASYQINELVKVVKAREETITDAIIKKQVKETFKEVEKEIEKVAQEEKIVIKTEKVEMKPPVVKEEKKETIEEVQAPDITKDESITTESSEEVEQAVVEEVSEVLDSELAELTAADLVTIGTYLVENYFLDGYSYYQEEKDPLRQMRKKLTHEMEVYVIESLTSVFDIVKDMQKINEATIGSILENAKNLSADFNQKFIEVEKQGIEFKEIYQEIGAYFNVYIGTLEAMQNSLVAMKQAPNPALVMTIIMKDLNEVIIPGLKNVINAGLDLKMQTNKIYLEGLEGRELLTREEVIGIIKDPTKILDQDKAPKPDSTIEPQEPTQTEGIEEGSGETTEEVPEEKPSEEAEVPEEKPSEEVEVPEEKPSEEAEVPEEKPSEEADVPGQEAGEGENTSEPAIDEEENLQESEMDKGDDGSGAEGSEEKEA